MTAGETAHEMKFTHRVVGPRKGTGNAFIPYPRRERRYNMRQERHVRPLVATTAPDDLPDTLEGVLKLVLHEIADGV